MQPYSTRTIVICKDKTAANIKNREVKIILRKVLHKFYIHGIF